MPREPIPTWFFVKVVVRQGDQFLLVQERRFNQPWHLPAGRAELGETLAAAALRETLEEAGVPIVLDGLLRVEHSPLTDRRDAGGLGGHKAIQHIVGLEQRVVRRRAQGLGLLN